MVASHQKASSGRLAVICFLPDPGHLIPLLKLARQAPETCEALVLVPDELAGLAASYGFPVAALGPVRPLDGLPYLHRYMDASEPVRIASAMAACDRHYFQPLTEAISLSFESLRARLSEFRPTHLLVDDHKNPRQFKKSLRDYGARVSFHCTAPNYRRHNTWTLRNCYWTDWRAALNDAVDKTRNEIRLWIRTRQAGRPVAATIADVGIPRKPVNHLSTGTCYLEKTLLSGCLLYTGEDRTVLPAVPPLQAPLPQDLREWLDRSAGADVVYISFGTVVRPKPGAIAKIVTAVLKENRRVLLQYTGDFPETPGVRLETWVPQTSVLAHPAVSLFVTHGGAASVEEALWAGKPMLCIPGVWDHYYNARTARLLGAGTTFPRRRLGSAERLSRAVRQAMRPQHTDAAQALAQTMRHQWSAHEAAVTGLFAPPQPTVRTPTAAG